jgi:hypothetical protein
MKKKYTRIVFNVFNIFVLLLVVFKKHAEYMGWVGKTPEKSGTE